MRRGMPVSSTFHCNFGFGVLRTFATDESHTSGIRKRNSVYDLQYAFCSSRHRLPVVDYSFVIIGACALCSSRIFQSEYV